MPTFHSLLPPTGNTTDLATYVTDIIDPLPNRLILVSVHCYIAAGSLQPPTPTVTGNGITYFLEKAQDVDNAGTDRSTLFVFRGMNSAPTKGAVTIAFGATQGNCAWNIDQSSADVDTSGTNGSGAIAQTTVGATSSTTVTTSPTLAFGSAMTSGNTGYFVSGIQTNGPQTPRTSWTETGDSSAISLCGLQAQYLNVGTDTAGSATWSTTARAGAILMEIKAGATSPNGLVAGRASSLTTSVNAVTGVRHPTPVLNDIEILVSASDSTQTLTIDALFTQLVNLTDGSLRAYLGYNVSDGTEVGDISVSSGATANRQVGLVAVFRGYTGIETGNIQSLAEGGTDSSHDSPSYTPINTGACVVFVYYERTSTSTVSPQTPPSPLVTAVEFGTSGSGGTYAQIAYKDTGIVSGTPVSPGPWASAAATGAAEVVAFELIPAASGSNFTQTPSDNEALTDAAAFDLGPAVSDTEPLTDTAALAQGKATAETLGTTDSALVSLGLDRASTDTLGLTDAAVVARELGAPASDNLGLTDSTSLDRVQAAPEALGLTDAAAVARGVAQASTDNLGLTDTTVMAIGQSRTDLAGMSDSVSVQASGDTSLAPTDNEGLTDSAALTRTQVSSDTGALTDSTSLAIGRTSAPADNLGLSDQVSLVISRDLGDVLTLTDAVSLTASFIRILTETTDLSDTALVSLTGPTSGITVRPNIGTTTRPGSGITPRPNTGTTVRPG